jgi:pimeloyl-ACP methyl ester carboxylesterase
MIRLAEDVLHLLDRLQIEKAVIGGHSMGGYVALAFARAYPHRLAGLALIASTTSADLPERRQSRLVMARNVKRRGTAVIAKRLPESMTDDPKVASQISEMISVAPPATVVGNLKGMAERDDSSEWVHNLCVPTLVLAGQEDKIIPIDKPRTFVQFFPRSWLIEVPGAGHMVPMESPEPVAKALKVLIRRAESVQVQQ